MNTDFKKNTAAMLRNIANKRTTTMVLTIKNSEKITIASCVGGLISFSILMKAIMSPDIVGSSLVEMVTLSAICGLYSIILFTKTKANIVRYQINFKAFDEIVKETDDDKLLDKWVSDGYLMKLKEIEDSQGEETKNTCLIDFLDKVKDINSQGDRIKTWDKVTKPNFMRTALEVFWILFKPAFMLVVIGRLAYILFV